MSPDMPWAASLVLTIGGLLILGGVIAFIAGLRHEAFATTYARSTL